MAGGRAAEFLAEATQVWVLPKGGISWVGPEAGYELIAGGGGGGGNLACVPVTVPGRTDVSPGRFHGACEFTLADAPRGSPAGDQFSH